MRFTLVDRVLERSADRLVAIKQVSLAEEYLQDHFPGFEVLPGVMMIEALVQSARLLLEEAAPGQRVVLGGVRALKYGTFVRPGQVLRVEVGLVRAADGIFEMKGEGRVCETGGDPAGRGIAVQGRFTMRPVSVSAGGRGG